MKDKDPFSIFGLLGLLGLAWALDKLFGFDKGGISESIGMISAFGSIPQGRSSKDMIGRMKIATECKDSGMGIGEIGGLLEKSTPTVKRYLKDGPYYNF